MEPKNKHAIAISNESGVPMRQHRLRAAILETLAGQPACRIGLLFTTDDGIRELNKQFRKIDEPTDVLSFPLGDAGPSHEPTVALGEIAISIPYATRQAEARGITVAEEVAVLAIHGTLHLLGYDDESPKDRVKMQSEMARIGHLVGLNVDPEWTSVL